MNDRCKAQSSSASVSVTERLAPEPRLRFPWGLLFAVVSNRQCHEIPVLLSGNIRLDLMPHLVMYTASNQHVRAKSDNRIRDTLIKQYLSFLANVPSLLWLKVVSRG